MSQNIHARIESLSPRFMKMAACYAGGTVETAEDLYQSMVVHLLERQAADPAFAEQSDSYLLDAGRKSVCWVALRRAVTVKKHTFSEPELLDNDDDSFFDTLPAPGVNPEIAVENLEQSLALAKVLRENLSKKEQEVLGMAVEGVPTGEIAARLNTSTAAVGVYKRRIANKLHFAL